MGLQDETVLSVDVGTQSVRALVFDMKGNVVDLAQVVYSPAYFSPRPGWAEQDPEYYWQCIVEACQRLWKNGIVTPHSLKAVALTTQRGTVINLDEEGKPLRPAILWLDQRRAKQLPSVGAGWDLLFKLTGLHKTVNYLQAEAEINWIGEQQPEILEKTKTYLFLSGYLTYRITGNLIDSIGTQVGYVPFDYKNQKWLRQKDWKWRAIPVSPDTVPPLLPPGERLGVVTASASRETGLPQGLPLIAAASDKACEVLGSGCHLLNQGCIGYGTTATIIVNSQKYIEPIPLVPAYPSANAGEYNLEVQTFRGFWMASWFKEQFAAKENELALELGIATEALLDEMAREVPPGSMGLMLQPYWSPGIRYPHPEAKGAIIGFGSVHTKAHMYRSLLEGLAFAVREGRERIERRSKAKITELYVSGGGSKSDLMMQITADVFGLETRRPAVSETSGLGAAMLACVGVGLHPNLQTAVREMARVGDVFEPNRDNALVYDQLYRQIYGKLYGRLRTFYQSIQQITGYPEIPGS
ncbi:FGGY-family carbohydrate kinase [Brevibacillus sp. SYSU BS000544]|uniref:FGGY-family carbohydrate kinase n=1 Tax=Brevibacillus sp. SYSU BS000544 TaxID=3416443 RepID=UPI003CE5C8EE